MRLYYPSSTPQSTFIYSCGGGSSGTKGPTHEPSAAYKTEWREAILHISPPTLTTNERNSRQAHYNSRRYRTPCRSQGRSMQSLAELVALVSQRPRSSRNEVLL